MAEGTDPNLLYDLQTRLAGFHLYTESEVSRFAEIYFDPKGTQDKLHAVVDPVVQRFIEASADDQAEFRSDLADYIRTYAFLSQIITFVDPDLEKLHVFGRLLLRKLPVSRDRLPLEVQQAIDIDSYRISQTYAGKIKLERGVGELQPRAGKGAALPPHEELEPLSRIIRDLNERFGTDFAEKDKLFIHEFEARLAGDAALEASVRVNPAENARLTFDHVANDHLQEMIGTNFKFYKQVTDDKEFAKAFFDWLFERYLKAA